MPIHPDWKPLYDSMMQHYCDGSREETSPEGGPCRKGEQVFYAYCKEHGIDYTKPRPKTQEAFRWVGDIIPEEREGRYFVRGEAIHPCKTYHPNEWPEVREYLEEELQAAAETLTGKPLLLDHSIVLGPPNRVLKSAWEDGAVEYVAEVDEKIYNLVKSGEINHVSIEYDWKVLEKVDGIAPRRIVFTGLSLLKQLKPGDPEASVEVWEGIIRELKEMSDRMSDTQEEASRETSEEPQEEGKKEGYSHLRQEAEIQLKWEPKTLDEFIDLELLKNRTIVFHGEVSRVTCEEAAKKLEYLGMISKKPIKVILNSVGGYVYDGLLVFDTIRKLVQSGIDVTCEARGLAASMGAIILQAGSRRIATPNTRFLIHEVSSWTWGKASDIEEQTEELKKVNDMLKNILSERTGKSPEEIERIWHKRDVWMSAEEAKAFGLIDEIVDETFFESVLREEDERERLRREQLERARKYGIEPKPGGHLTKPAEYEDIPEDQFADPVNWRYPIDPEHVRAALTYFNMPKNRRAGGYTHEEQVIILERIIRAALNAGIEVSWQPEDPVYRDLPEDLKRQLKGYEAEEGVEESVDELKERLEEALKKIKDLEEQKASLEAKLSLGEAIVEPGVPEIPPGYVDARRILAILPKQVPYRWGAGPHELVRRLRKICREALSG
jgi:ATP-dependent Clp protease protease subunit